MSAVEVPSTVLDLEERLIAARKEHERARGAASAAFARMDDVDEELRDARLAAGLCVEDHIDGNHRIAPGSPRFCSACIARRLPSAWAR